jgi:NAD(P)-dependent dehydrogenase (short-subunit alcohol dehydrogenase family)
VKIDLDGRIALVTGGAEGVGKGIAQTLAQAGAFVVVCDVQDDKGEATVQAIRAAGGGSTYVHADVGDAGMVEALAGEVRNRWGKLHVLVNNAGAVLFRSVGATTSEDWSRLMRVDLWAVHMVTRTFLPLLVPGASAVTQIASVHALASIADMSVYAAAKGGVISMVRSMAQELGPRGIRVNALSPGFVETPLFRSWLESEPDPKAALARVVGLLPLGRIATARDVGNLVAFLSSDLASCVTGANYVIDCGQTARLIH